MRLLVALCVLAACANANPDAGTLEVAPSAVTIGVGAAASIQATTDKPLAGLHWESQDPAIASVSGASDGSATITGIALGRTTVTAYLGVLARTVDVTVTDATLDRIDVTAARTMLPRGVTQQLAASGHYTDGHTADITADVAWSSTAGAIASIDDAGVATAHELGDATIHADLAAVTGELALVVRAAELTAISVGPPQALAKGLTLQLVATGTLTDGTITDVTTTATWSSGDPSIATVTGAGLVHGIAIGGPATISASSGPVTGSAAIQVGPAIVVAITIAPDPLAMPLGLDVPLTANGTFSDATTGDVTAQATWTITAGTAVTVSATGVVHAASQGAGTVKAAIGTAADTVDASVGPAIADHIAIAPGDVQLAQQQRVQLRATLVFTDATATDITATATWSSNAASATVVAGTVDATTQAGAATITASASGKSASIVATVTTAACHPVINEVQAGGVTAGDEWVELFDPCTVAFDLTGWTLVYRAATTIGATDTNNLQSLAGTLAPGDLRLYVGPAFAGGATPDGTPWGGAQGLLQATNGALGLRSGPKDTGPLVDSMAYGAVTAGHPFLEGVAAPALANGKSDARSPFDGNDTNANATNFALVAVPTPRARNTP